MDKYKCTCCGGTINRATMMCEYCGTLYKEEMGVLRVEMIKNPVHTLEGKCLIPRREINIIGAQECAQIAMRRIRDDIAEALVDVMSYDIERAPVTDGYMIRGQIKAVIPINRGEGNIINTFNGR